MASDQQKVLDAGMNDHIAKPLDVGVMFATMAKWIQPAAFRAPASAAPPAAGAAPAVASATPELPTLPGVDTAAGLARPRVTRGCTARCCCASAPGRPTSPSVFAEAGRGPTRPAGALRPHAQIHRRHHRCGACRMPRIAA